MFPGKNIRYYYLVTKRKIRNFLLSDKSREFLIFLFFFFVASGFWLLQTLKNDFQADFTIPVRLRDVPEDVVITSEIQDGIRVTVKDKGTVLLNYLFGQTFFPVFIDFKDYNQRGNNVKIPTRELERRISSQLNSSSVLVSMKPDTLDFIYTQGKSSRLPVRLNGIVSANRQYYITDTIFTPDSVTIYAPREILDTMKSVNTLWLNLANLADTLKITTTLAQDKGIKLIPSSVKLEIPIDVITEKTVEVPIIPIDFPKDKILRTFPSKVKVVFQVGLNRFKTISPEDFVLVVSYDELIKNTDDKYKLKLQAIPSGVSHPRIIPEEIDYLIEQINHHGN